MVIFIFLSKWNGYKIRANPLTKDKIIKWFIFIKIINKEFLIDEEEEIIGTRGDKNTEV